MTPALMAVHAHPDDECITTGGVLAAAAAAGHRTAVVTCTGGELGQVVGEGMVEAEVRPRLAAVRRQELAAALALLGAGAPRTLGYRDSGMLGTDGNYDVRSFWRAHFDEAVGAVVAEIRSFRPDVLVSYDAFGVYGHPDHVQTSRVAMAAVEAAAVGPLHPQAGPAWRVRKVYQSTVPRSFMAMANAALGARGMPSPFGDETDPSALAIGTPDEHVTTTVDVRDHLATKLAALRAHRSQVGRDSFFLNLPADLEDLAFGVEWFVRVRSDVAVPDDEDDLFAGLEAVSSRWGAPHRPTP